MAQRHGEVEVIAYQGHTAHGEQTWASIQADWPQLCVVALSRAMFKRLTRDAHITPYKAVVTHSILLHLHSTPVICYPDLRVKKGEFQKETHKTQFLRSYESQTKMPFGPVLTRKHVSSPLPPGDNGRNSLPRNRYLAQPIKD